VLLEESKGAPRQVCFRLPKVRRIVLSGLRTSGPKPCRGNGTGTAVARLPGGLPNRGDRIEPATARPPADLSQRSIRPGASPRVPASPATDLGD
jgi:hypothetical protein